MNNFEKIKAMDIDKIAKCLRAFAYCDTLCAECFLTKVGISTFCSINMTGDGLKEWLELEVRE